MRCKCGSEWIVVCAHCHQYAPSSEWINVKDKLPKQRELVLVWTATGICIAALCGKTITGDKPTWIECNGDYDFWNVTHWMPLPLPPECNE